MNRESIHPFQKQSHRCNANWSSFEGVSRGGRSCRNRHNLVERAPKKAILHRKNSLFYKTRKGAQMGDLFMSLIHTCELNGANAFDYLMKLLRHAEELKRNPSEWMPWNYRDTLARFATPAAA